MLAHKADAAAQKLRQLLTQMQPQTSALVAFGPAASYLGKGLEEFDLVLRFDPDSGITNSNSG